MGFETPKPLSREERKNKKNWTTSDAKLLKKGSEVRDDGSIRATKIQIEKAKAEKEEGQPYHERININGIEISVGWDMGYGEYVAYISDPEWEKEAKEKDLPEGILRIKLNKDPKWAREVFEYAKQKALEEKESDADTLGGYVEVYAYKHTK